MRHTFFIIAAAAIMLGSCRERTEQQLLDSIEEAWQQGETALQEAQTRAEGLRDSVRHSSEYVRQKYNLLAIRLRDKNDMMPSSPDSALQVMSYFESRQNVVDKERAFYYMGSTYRDLKDYPKAVSCLLVTTAVLTPSWRSFWIKLRKPATYVKVIFDSKSFSRSVMLSCSFFNSPEKWASKICVSVCPLMRCSSPGCSGWYLRHCSPQKIEY